ncbi:hypothetical protein D9M73_171040 [compost metagenome]
MLELELQALTLLLLHLVAALDQAILDALGAAFQAFQLGQLRAELLLGINRVFLGGIRFEQGHLIVQDGNLHFGESRGGDQRRSHYGQLGQLTHDALLDKPLSLSKGRP